ncbi:MAG TPA: hypothetical protein VK821_07645, partial [Dehalococcoidia bacterium]|nr:hypothetical protein [Dehalococcoidia bacterium]
VSGSGLASEARSLESLVKAEARPAAVTPSATDDAPVSAHKRSKDRRLKRADGMRPHFREQDGVVRQTQRWSYSASDGRE